MHKRPTSDRIRKNSCDIFFEQRKWSKLWSLSVFLATLEFKANNNTFVHDAVIKEFPSEDGRGRQSNKWKFDESIVVEHIMGFHPQTSHYRREHAPHRLYLPSDVTISKMFNLFIQQEPLKPCSYEYYRKVVDKLKISFTKLGHEQCEDCEIINQHKHGPGVHSSNCDICIRHERHKNFYTQARINYEADKLIATDPKNVIVSSDMQKVVMLPRMEQFKEVICISTNFCSNW